MVFSGIVETQGRIVSMTPMSSEGLLSGVSLVIEPLMKGFLNADVVLGCSIAVNGTCLTVTKFDKKVLNVVSTLFM